VPSGTWILKSLRADRDVQIVAGRRQRALAHQSRRADGFDAATDIDTDRQDGALVGSLRADAAHVIVDQILKRGALLLVAVVRMLAMLLRSPER